jgi:hypothetical protein
MATNSVSITLDSAMDEDFSTDKYEEPTANSTILAPKEVAEPPIHEEEMAASPSKEECEKSSPQKPWPVSE